MSLRILREINGYTQKELAKEFNITVIHLCMLENRKVNLSPKMRRKYMNRFNLTPLELETHWQKEEGVENEQSSKI